MTTKLPFPLLAAILIGLAGCVATPAADYTSAEAPKHLTVENASHSINVFFVPGTDRLAPGQAVRLGRLVASGAIGPHDRLSVSPAGPPNLAARRTAAIAAVMLRYGITIQPMRLSGIPRNSAVIEIGRYLVRLPDCPDWSKPASADFSNMNMSDFGCATVTNLGEMVADPADLVSGRPLGLTAGTPAAAAVNRYENDKVYKLPVDTAVPFASSSGS